jgi:hypothetical protein
MCLFCIKKKKKKSTTLSYISSTISVTTAARCRSSPNQPRCLHHLRESSSSSVRHHTRRRRQPPPITDRSSRPRLRSSTSSFGCPRLALTSSPPVINGLSQAVHQSVVGSLCLAFYLSSCIMDVHPDNMTFFQIESIVEQYGYSPSDLIYFRDPTKNLVDGI